MTKWQPAGNKILVRMDPVEEKTASGIVLRVASLQQREEMAQMRGTIVAVGPTAWHDQRRAWAYVGDRVMFAKYAGYLLDEGEDHYRIMHDLDIVAVLGE